MYLEIEELGISHWVSAEELIHIMGILGCVQSTKEVYYGGWPVYHFANGEEVQLDF